MTAKERIRHAVRREATDLPAAYIWFSPEWEIRLAAAMGVDRLDLHPALGNDIVPVDLGINGYMMEAMPEGTERRHEFGFTFRKVGESFCIVDYPIRSLDDIARYRHPDPRAPGRYAILERQVATYGREYPILVDISPIAFEAAYSLMGMEETMLALAEAPERLGSLFEKHITYTLEVARECIARGADIVWTGDDWGTQQGMLLSPAMWREQIKPMVARLWTGLKQAGRDVAIAHHSCGAIAPIIPDLIALGLDILNPIQPNVPGMAPAELQQAHGSKLSFLGGIDTQGLLRTGSPAEVEAVARGTIATFGPGYILSPAHRIHDVPWANIQALFRAAGRKSVESLAL